MTDRAVPTETDPVWHRYFIDSSQGLALYFSPVAGELWVTNPMITAAAIGTGSPHIHVACDFLPSTAQEIEKEEYDQTLAGLVAEVERLARQ